MIAIVCIAFAAHVVAWIVLPTSGKSVENVNLSGAIQASAV